MKTLTLCLLLAAFSYEAAANVNLIIKVGESKMPDLDYFNWQSNDVFSPQNIYVFEDQMFHMHGRVTDWECYMNGRGSMNLLVFKKNHHNGEAYLVGKTHIESQTDNIELKSFSVATFDIFPVEGDYFIAVHFESVPNVASIVTEIPPGVDSNVQIGEMVVHPFVGPLDHGYTFNYASAPDKRVGALGCKALIMGLNPALNHNKASCPESLEAGTAEICRDGVCEYICDRWFHMKGWPNLFCVESGYPGSHWVYYTSHPELLGSQNSIKDSLKGKLSVDQHKGGIQSLPEHPNGKCGPGEGVCVACSPVVELYGPYGSSEGWVYFYDYAAGWGYMCQTQEALDAEEEALDAEEVTNIKTIEKPEDLICQGLGYKKADYKINRDNIGNGPRTRFSHPTNLPPTLKNPVCSVGTVEINKCTHEIGACDSAYQIYIKCDDRP